MPRHGSIGDPLHRVGHAPVDAAPRRCNQRPATIRNRLQQFAERACRPNSKLRNLCLGAEGRDCSKPSGTIRLSIRVFSRGLGRGPLDLRGRSLPGTVFPQIPQKTGHHGHSFASDAALACAHPDRVDRMRDRSAGPTASAARAESRIFHSAGSRPNSARWPPFSGWSCRWRFRPISHSYRRHRGSSPPSRRL